MANVYDFVDKAVLPDEYLPDEYTGPSAGPEKQIIGKEPFSRITQCYSNYIKACA